MELGDRERGVVDGSERGPGDQQDGEAEMSGEIGTGEAGGVGDEKATGGFNQEAVASGGELVGALEDGGERDGDAVVGGGGLGSGGEAQGVEADELARTGCGGSAVQRRWASRGSGSTPVSAGLKGIRRRPRWRAARRSAQPTMVLPTPVSVPAMKSPGGGAAVMRERRGGPRRGRRHRPRYEPPTG